MKSLALWATALVLAAGFVGCQSTSNEPKPILPPGSGGRGDSPGMHAQSQTAR